MIDDRYKYSEETSKIIGCAIVVHNQLGNGFQEVIYQRALEIEFSNTFIPFKREFQMPVMYKGGQDCLNFDPITIGLADSRIS